MNARLRGEVTLMFIRGGISSKNKKPYLNVSNGRSELYVNIPKSIEIDENTFADLEEGSEITIEVETLVGSDTVKLLSLG